LVYYNYSYENIKIIFILFRIKQRTIKEIEKDLSNEKIFEMTMQIKGLSLLSPEYGVFKQFAIFVF
jgi:hypothetical protein